MRLSESDKRIYAECQARITAHFAESPQLVSTWWKSKNPLLGNLSPLFMINNGRAAKLHKFIEAQLDENNPALPWQVPEAKIRRAKTPAEKLFAEMKSSMKHADVAIIYIRSTAGNHFLMTSSNVAPGDLLDAKDMLQGEIRERARL